MKRRRVRKEEGRRVEKKDRGEEPITKKRKRVSSRLLREGKKRGREIT